MAAGDQGDARPPRLSQRPSPHPRPRPDVPAGAAEREFGSMHRALWCRTSDRVATTFLTLWMVGFWVGAVAWRFGADGRTVLIVDGVLILAAVLALAPVARRKPAPADRCRHRISWPTRLVHRIDVKLNQLDG